ncbi:GNAT family N-acetyltransferase [Streptomyces misionensis]|uniref:GNAT family N-acetyltransferase n=1 Tax=Streptomyces misionensis TaxID=67331 RepID=UPI00341A7AB7
MSASTAPLRLEETARAEGCTRMEWTTDRDNPEAQKFYQALGATPGENEIFYRLATS